MTRSVPTRQPLLKALSRGRTLALTGLLGVTLALAPALSAQAQSFGPAIRVNDKVITQYEIDQRALMLRTFNAPGDPQELARQQLIEDRLKEGAADRFDVKASPEDIDKGMDDFVSRSNMDKPTFIAELGKVGVAEQTFRAFVASNVIWQKVVRGLYGSKVQITEAEVDRAIASQGQQSALQVAISEIFIPTANDPQAALQLATQLSQITSVDEFSAAARDYSAAPSRDAGGQVDWMSASNLPPALQSSILGLQPGQVTQPIEVTGAYALFQLRGIRETGGTRQGYSAIDYAEYFIPGGRSPEALAAAAKITARLDRCDDLYGVAKGQPEEVLQRLSQAPSEIPQDVAMELAKLDDNEVSTALTRNNGQTLMLLMLCGRTPIGADAEVDRTAVLQQLQNRRLASLADGYLAQLRAEARIVE